MKKKKIMFDCNAFDKVILVDSTIDLLISKLDICEYSLITTQRDELNKITDIERKRKLLGIIERLNMETVYTTPAIYGKVKYGMTKYGGDKTVFENVIFKTKKNINDALIANSAVRENCIVITNDKDFYKKMKNNNYQVMTFEEFIKNIIQ